MTDPNTGLPEVPTGYRWRVGPTVEHTHLGSREHPFLLSLYLEKLGDAVLEGTRSGRGVQNRAPYGYRYEKPEMIHERGGSFEWSLWGSLKSETVRYSRWETWKSEPLKGNHPVAVVKAANRIIKMKRAADVRASIIGIYPPKKLGDA